MITLFAHMDKTQRMTLIAAFATVTTVVVSIGFTFLLLTLILEARGTSETVIGLNAAMAPLGIICAGPLIPLLAKRFGNLPIAMASALLVAGSILALKALPQIEWWFFLRFLMGVGDGILFALSESWIVRSAEGPSRGRIMALYACVVSIGFSIGSFTIPHMGIEGWFPFVFCAGIVAIACLPLVFVKLEDMDSTSGSHLGFFSFIRLAPVLLTGIFVFACLDASTMALLPVFSLQHGLGMTEASYLLGVLIIGNAFLQFPIGWLADHYEKLRLLAICAAFTVAASLVLPHVINSALKWPVVVILGASGFGIYTIGLAVLGERFKGASVVAGSSAFAAMWGFGGLVAPPIAGVSMQNFGPNGLPYFIAVLFAGYFCMLIWAVATKRRA